LALAEKRTWGAVERDERLRAAWRVTVAQEIAPERWCSRMRMDTNNSLRRFEARTTRGERVSRTRAPPQYHAPIEHDGRRYGRPVSSGWGQTTGAVFEVYIERFFLPSLRRGQVAVMDYPSTHKGEWVRVLIRSVGWELPYLPPCASDSALSRRPTRSSSRVFFARQRPGADQKRWRRAWVMCSRKALPVTQEGSLSIAHTSRPVNIVTACASINHHMLYHVTSVLSIYCILAKLR
jgi:hypothetical protein